MLELEEMNEGLIINIVRLWLGRNLPLMVRDFGIHGE